MNIADFIERGNPEDEEGDFNSEKPLNADKNQQNRAQKAKLPSKSHKTNQPYVIIAIVILSATASLGFGLLSGQEAGNAGTGGLVVSSVPMTHPASAMLSSSALDASTIDANNPASSSIPSGGEVVADSSTHMYYLPWCAQVASISKADEVWFATDKAAISAGYAPGKSCAGI